MKQCTWRAGWPQLLNVVPAPDGEAFCRLRGDALRGIVAFRREALTLQVLDRFQNCRHACLHTASRRLMFVLNEAFVVHASLGGTAALCVLDQLRTCGYAFSCQCAGTYHVDPVRDSYITCTFWQHLQAQTSKTQRLRSSHF